MANLLRGTALITGAASGIGHHTALSFAKYGKSKLALADMNPSALTKSAKAIRAQYPSLQIVELTMDVRQTDEVKAGFAATVAQFGRLDVAVNNAGIRGPAARTDETDEAEWAETIDIDLAGVWRCQREALRVMVGQEDLGPREGRGRIINTASMLGLSAPPRGLVHTPYTAAKHGVMGLTKADAVIYGEQGIRINAICPGWTETPLIRDPKLPLLTREIERGAIPRIAHVDEVADAMVFLASPLSSFMQGASLLVDGGFTLT
ncbi:short chain dehydrogenase reductase [Apiospora hydei]|uniref:Short chain dehydrogenase reductase n=1 Tax=Apiospora hydei TaxID=1337664 RepID=A0ABR1XE14_9PEZI